MIDLEHVLVVAALLFSIGLFVALSKRNAVGILMGIELMLNSVNLNLVGITVAAAEAAVALALAVAVYRLRESIDVDRLNLMKW
jgi:NADH:ubiquinone oxidoreductase subunit K